MIRLPALFTDELSWQLPLSDDAAGMLLNGFLANDPKPLKEQFAELLADEPTLLLWSICRSPSWQSQPPDSLDDVAVWLREHGLFVLRWDHDGSPARHPCSPSQLGRWADLAVRSVGVARMAAELADPRDAPGAVVRALLHNAGAWLASCGSGPDMPAPELARTCLPPWLVDGLQSLSSSTRGDPVVNIVGQACAQWRQQSAEEHDLSPAGTDAAVAEFRTTGDRVRHRWLNTRTDFGGFFPMLLQRLRRLRQLEDRFTEVLEEEKLEALKAFAYGASHEINNPLANISTRAQTLLRDEKDPERRRKLAVINTQAFRAHELIADLMLFARPPELSVTNVDLVSLADRVVAELFEDAEAQQTLLRRLPACSPVTVLADPGHLASALRALCVNSLEALRLGGRIEISVHANAVPPSDSDGRAWAEIRVADTGPGIPPEVRRHLFDPYFSGREAGRGLGLGLTKSWRIVTGHGGRIDVDNLPQQGAVFRIRLPDCQTSSSADPAPSGRIMPHQAKGTSPKNTRTGP